ncbi:MAG TPA: hypothetical protein VLA40_12485 [Rheinheimera sp.]|nr:hypothetical protein [Rheinheimera sp.]
MTTRPLSAVLPVSIKLSALALCIGLLPGCSTAPVTSARPTLAQLPAFDRTMLANTPPVTEQQLDQLYQQILALQPAPEMRQKILYRLSQMYTSQLERAELPVAEEQQALQQLVERYEALLEAYPADPNNELIRYQLARSYDLLGQQQACLQQLNFLLQLYPESPFASEAWFRKADIHFSRNQYHDALDAYLAVLNGSDDTLHLHGRYMAGWSYFKLQQFEQADEQFLRLLDQTYTETVGERDEVAQRLQQEVMRTLSISLSYQQQAPSLQGLLQRVDPGNQPRPIALIAALYQDLAQFLADKTLYAESLQSYRLFITDYPDSILAARFQLVLIRFYLEDADAERALQAQAEYIALFGPDTSFWQIAGRAELTEVQGYLLQYLDYFARNGYASAQAQPQGELRREAFAAVVPYWQKMLVVLTEPMLSDSDNAAQYPLADIRYLLAESYAAAAMPEQALALYRDLGFDTLALASSLFKAQDAAYKALLLSEQLTQTGQQPSAAHWQLQSRFVSQHQAHPAAQQVALQQLQQRYTEQDYQAVLANSSSVIDWPVATSSNPQLVLEAQFLHSQSELALGLYSAAEQSISLLLRQTVTGERRSLLTQQLASSIYQQAQAPDATSDQVMVHLQRLLTVLPDSAFHEAAAFEQIELTRAAADYVGAIALLERFIARYAQTERGQSAKALLLDSYEQAQMWDKAAAELNRIANASQQADEQREARYLAAQYYQRSGNTEQALNSWRSYANQYPQPHALAQEARLQLVQLYQTNGDLYRQNFWRNKIASFEQQFADQGTERTQQLAAQALLELGRHESGLFNAVRLSHPLKQSLNKKRQHMTAAIKRYEESIQYGIAGLVSEAQFRVAELYQQMAKALLASDRPKGLDELALEEYELLLEEQAYPFEEQAIAIYQQNTRLIEQQAWDSWVQQSFARLAQLLPAKFDKTEVYLEVADDVF